MSELSGEVLGAGDAATPESAKVEVPPRDAIARRAYEISRSDESGSEEENWRRAEAELRNEAGETS